MKYVNNDDIDSILKLYGYEKNPDFKHKDSTYNNIDIEGGFQDMNPLIFVIIGEVIGDIISENLPFNVGNTFSNLIILIGQIIETYGTQQEYYENGPGNIFNPNNKNIGNEEYTNEFQSLKNEVCDVNKRVNEVYKILEKIQEKLNKL